MTEHADEHVTRFLAIERVLVYGIDDRGVHGRVHHGKCLHRRQLFGMEGSGDGIQLVDDASKRPVLGDDLTKIVAFAYSQCRMQVRQALHRQRRGVVPFDGLGERIQQLRHVVANRGRPQPVDAGKTRDGVLPFIENALLVFANERAKARHPDQPECNRSAAESRGVRQLHTSFATDD